MKILDMSAGNRGTWWNRQYPDSLYLDIRPEVNPDLVCDTRAMPVEVGSGYDLIVFDPPHVNFGVNGHMSVCYGHHTTADIRSIIEGSANEAHRVSRPDALMAFKWNDHDQSFAKVLALMAAWWEPLFGTVSSGRMNNSRKTAWVMLRRIGT